jgi:multiple sugar transport system ATP-binding protein
MGDRIAVMRSGKLVQVGDPLSIYDAPVDQFVGSFIGNPPMNFLAARIEERDGGFAATLDGAGDIPLDAAADELASRAGRDLLLGIRAEHIEIDDQPGTGGGPRGRVIVVEPLGSHNLVTLRVGDAQLKATTRPDATFAPDQEVGVRIDPARIRWLDAERGVAVDAADAGPGAGLGPPRPEEHEDAGDKAS